MGYWLQEKLSVTITIDGVRISNEDEHDTPRLERMFALIGKVAVSVAKHSQHLRLGLQAVRSIEEIAENAGDLTVTWRKRDDFASFWPFVEQAWRDISGPTASVLHKLGGEVVTPVPLPPGSYGAGNYSAGTYGGAFSEQPIPSQDQKSK